MTDYDDKEVIDLEVKQLDQYDTYLNCIEACLEVFDLEGRLLRESGERLAKGEVVCSECCDSTIYRISLLMLREFGLARAGSPPENPKARFRLEAARQRFDTLSERWELVAATFPACTNPEEQVN